MESKRKTCFVVSPIGEDGSDTRKLADDLLELAIEPALQPFNFEVVRADRIAKPTMITNDIVQLVQDSQLCIIDLTGHNPNVYYEAGRRHETGKPAIQVIKKDERIPFDLAGIRTITYDLETPRSVHDFIQKLQQFVKEFEQSEYSIPASSASLSSIAKSLDRLERKIDSVKGTPTSAAVGGLTSFLDRFPEEARDALPEGFATEIQKDPLWATLLGPQQRFMAALRSGNLDAAADVVKNSKSVLSEEKYDHFASMVALAGHPVGLELVLDGLKELIETGNKDLWQRIVFRLGAAVQYYSARDIEAEGVDTLDEYFRSVLKHFDDDPEAKAFAFGQRSKLYAGMRDFENALINVRKAVELRPEERAYQTNLKTLERWMREKLDKSDE